MNYEDVKNLELGIVVKNKAPLYQGSDPSSTISVIKPSGANAGEPKTTVIYPVKINVLNEPEGARFDPKVKTIHISEEAPSFNINEVIATYPAINDDTGKQADNIRSVCTHFTVHIC